VRLRLGTRGSDLARTQSTTVARALEAHGCEVELVVIGTAGDRSSAPSFAAIGPQGVFVREIEQALLARDVDLAVHSYKDLPTRSPAGLVVAAVPPRHDPADYLVARPEALAADAAHAGGADASDGSRQALVPLAPGLRVGTSSARRQVWLRHFRAGLEVLPLRGNVPTRLRRLADGDYDAILLAGAGIERLEAGSDALAGLREELRLVRLDPARFVAAPAQGALAVQCRDDDARLRDVLIRLDDARSRAAVTAERDVLARAEAGCDAAFGAYCAPADDAGFELTVMGELDGRIARASVRAATTEGLGLRAWQALEAAARETAR